MKIFFFMICVLTLKSCAIYYKKLQPRVIRGIHAYKGQFPWTVYIDMRKSYCTGALISSRWVLTAAHCFIIRPTSVTCYLGSVHKHGGIKMLSTTIITHPDYNAKSNTRDIALVKLFRNVKFTHFIRPILLPRKWMTYSRLMNRICFFAGFGRFTNAKRSKVLRFTRMQIISKQNCYNGHGLTSDKICTRTIYADYKMNTCQGDSGGGLALSHGGRFYVIGVDSYGISKHCSSRNKTTVVQSVLMNLRWIYTVMAYST